MPSSRTAFHSSSPEETFRLAARLVETLPRGSVLALHGDLGAGKTCLVQGLAAALGLEVLVSSPTFTIVHEYAGDPGLNHIDLYRIGSEEEAADLGLEDYLEPTGYTAIEWADRAAGLLPERTVHIRLTPGEGPNERHIVISGGSL